jgi:CO/xanthine dehydrogenase FAD-binding subunit
MVKAYRPLSLQEAVTIRGENRVVPLAGGTDLMVDRKRWSGLAPAFSLPVLFIGHLRELMKVAETADSIVFGSACTFSSLLANTMTPETLKTAVAQIASPAVRNRGTIGGNICNASPAGDTLPILYSLNAKVVLTGSLRSSVLPIEKLIKGPGETALRDDQLLTEVFVPKQSFNIFFYRKIGPRKVNSCAKLSFTGMANVAGGRIADIRIAFGSVAPTVVRSGEIEGSLLGKSKKEVFDMKSSIIDSYTALLSPIDDQRCTMKYRKTVSLRLLDHFLTSVLFAKRA